MPRGRPKESLNEKIAKHVSVDTLAKLYAEGKTDEQVAHVLNITARTLRFWKKDPDFLSAPKKAKDLIDACVERSLFERATGYSFASEKIFCHEGRVTRVKCIEHIPPDPTSMIFWLKNRQPERWREKVDKGEDDRLINQELTFDDIPSNGEGLRRFERFIHK